MKQHLLHLAACAALLLAGGLLSAQEIVYTDAAAFPLYGKALDGSAPHYGRLPAALESELKELGRTPVWELGRDAAGLFLRFRSDSPVIKARWTNLYGARMNHMTPTGSSGLDLYILDGKEWRFAGSGRPTGKISSDELILDNADGTMHEYILYLPLYDGLEKLEIGTREGAVIEGPAVPWPAKEGKVVMYGTSILQGGCANRPGMAFTSIISRRLGCEVVTLGFSGNGQLDAPIARLMAQVEHPAVFVMDEVPNCNADRIDEKGEEFFRILRDAHPDVPVVFVENPLYTHMEYNRKMHDEVISRNAAQKRLFQKLKKAGEKRIYYVPADKLIGTDGEATIDGVHFTDLGMIRYADVLTPLLRKLTR